MLFHSKTRCYKPILMLIRYFFTSMLMIDAEKGLEAQDMNIIGLAHKYRKGIVLMVNKWDLVTKDTKTADTYRKTFEENSQIY